MSFPRFWFGLLCSMVWVASASGADYFLADTPAQLYRATEADGSAHRLSNGLDGWPANAAVLDFAVAQDGAVAVLSAATNLAAGVEAWDGPQVFLKETSGGWQLISRDAEDNGACGAFAPLLFLDLNGDGLEELVFEAGPSFAQNGSVAPQLRGYVGPIAYDRAGATFTAFLPAGGDAPQTALALETRRGEVLTRSGSASLAAAAGLSGDATDRWYRREGGGGWTYLVEAGAGGADYAFWRAYLSGFTAGQIGDDAVSGPEADPDGDSVVNAIEAATGGNPLLRDVQPLLLVSDGASFRLLVRQPEASPAARLMNSDDLGDWWPAAGQGVDGTPRWRDGSRWLEYHLSLSNDDPRWFFRLQTP